MTEAVAASRDPVATPRPVVLVMIGAFWPGNPSSGPNQSFAALAAALSDRYDFKLLARDRPFGARRPTGSSEEWTDLGFARVRYHQVGIAGAVALRRRLRETPHDLLWMNGTFDREFTLPALLMRRFWLIPARPALLSPRGEFAAGALALKSGRKRLLLKALRGFGLLHGLTLHATSATEARDIEARLPRLDRVALAPNIRRAPNALVFSPADDEALRILFVGRITPVKQLHYALDVLKRSRVPVRFDIFGPVQDDLYWRRCQVQMAGLTAHVRAAWHGEASNNQIIAALARTDLFLLPTAGENFGHAIFEALSCGVPVLISDQTPWRGLKTAQAGWDLPLDRPEAFAAAIEDLAAMPEAARATLRRGARAVAARWIDESKAVEANIAMLHALIGKAPA